ncbi:Subtilisin-like protease SBT5.3, partial [Linum perenne]
RSSTSILLLLLSFLLSFQIIQVLAARKSYVVYLGRNAHGSKRTALDGVAMSDTYHKLLASSMKSKDEAKEAIFYSYSSHINAFAATLEDEQVGQLSSHPEVVSVIPNEEYELQTTRSWEFMGLEGRGGNIPDDSIWKKARLGEDVIIANLDTGVWPESTSFDCSETLDAVPTRWKGECEATDDFKCNRKLIGARSFNKGNRAARGQDMDATTSVRDTVGHGTHTLSTAGGCFVPGANLLGSANGTAKGGSPKARLATYKVCWPGCYSADILAAFDAAIQDGVDILSLSLGSSSPRSYDSDTIAIGSFHAVRNGITVVCSAGNSGPYPSSVTNVSPWILTVAASTVDRRFLSNVTLGNGQRFTGFSFNANSLPAGQLYPLITGVAAKSSDAEDSDAKYCFPEALDASKVKGRIVLCRSGGSDIEKSQGIFKAGGVGMILGNSFSNSISPQPHFVPASMVSKEDSDSITSYISTASSPEAYISGGTEIGVAVAPVMASFSSAGPNRLTPHILKPDITAPGVYILAAYTEATGDSDSRRLPFNIISGTSMSCPHITGIAGLLKTIHPDWSPAAIKSAIMTTATTTSNTGDEIMSATGSKANPFNYGAGHVRPNKAMDPGLVYDSNLTDYLNFLCYIGYNDEQMSVFYDKSYKCPANSSTASLLNINHPSITVPELSEDVTVTRTLKNVGTSGTYTVSVRAPTGISVRVEPTSLVFRKMNEEKSFEVRLKEDQEVNAGGEYVFGQLIWSDGFHNVTSHIIVRSHTNQIELM